MQHTIFILLVTLAYSTVSEIDFQDKELLRTSNSKQAGVPHCTASNGQVCKQGIERHLAMNTQ